MLFTDNTRWHRYTQIYSIQRFFSQPTPLLPVLALICTLLYDLTPLFTYLENQLLLHVMRIPIQSCPWFAINCSPLAASPTPRHPTDQVTYLHRRNQQRQPFCLTQFQLTRRGQCWGKATSIVWAASQLVGEADTGHG
jgi:hypothetical protein